MAFSFWLLSAAVFLVDDSDRNDAATIEQARFEGVWCFALVEVEDRKQPEAPFETNKIIIRADGSYVVVQGERVTRGVFKVDPTKTPKHFDVTITDGPAKGRTFAAIYALSGDTYTFCGSLRSKDRPTALMSAEGSGTMLQVLKREKQKVKDALTELSRQELAGTWESVSVVSNGEKGRDDKPKLLFESNGKARLLAGKLDVRLGTTEIDPMADPMTIDVFWKTADGAGEKSRGIYKIEGERPTIRFAATGKDRPKEFSSEPGSGDELATYERAKVAERKRER